MPIRRSYADHGDACAAARAMDVVGDRWAVPIIRELTLGPKTFSGLQQNLPGVAPDVLTTRLRELQEAGVLLRVGDSRGADYRLTQWGQAFRPVLEALGRWSLQGPPAASGGGLTTDSAALAMSTTAPNPSVSVAEFDLVLIDARSGARGVYRVHWSPDSFGITRRPEAGPDQVTCDATVWARLLRDADQGQLHQDFLASSGSGASRARAVLADFRRSSASGPPAAGRPDEPSLETPG